jgi:transmembrane protein
MQNQSPGATTPTLILAMLDNRITMGFARLCMILPFLVAGIFKLLNWHAGVSEMASVGLPYPDVFNAAALVTELVGSALVLFNRWTWLGAGALGIFTVLSTFLAHRFWELPEPARTMQMNSFLEHATICAAFILVVVAGHRTQEGEEAQSYRHPVGLRPQPLSSHRN